MVILRYLAAEVYKKQMMILAVLVLLLFFSSLLRLIHHAALMATLGMIIHLAVFNMPEVISYLLPVTFFVALLSTLFRLSSQHETMALMTSGLSECRLISYVLLSAIPVFLISLILFFWIMPFSKTQYYQRAQKSQKTVDLSQLMPGTVSHLDGLTVFLPKKHSAKAPAKIVIINLKDKQGSAVDWSLIVGDRTSGQRTHHRALMLANGKIIQAKQELENYKQLQFKSMWYYLPAPNLNAKFKLSSLSIHQLWHKFKRGKSYRIEFWWRISMIGSVFLLAFAAVRMSQYKQRSNKQMRLISGMLVLLIFFQLLFVTRHMLAIGFLPEYLGLWWVYALYIALFSYRQIYKLIIRSGLRGSHRVVD